MCVMITIFKKKLKYFNLNFLIHNEVVNVLSGVIMIETEFYCF